MLESLWFSDTLDSLAGLHLDKINIRASISNNSAVHYLQFESLTSCQASLAAKDTSR